jgi:hypothetical protein
MLKMLKLTLIERFDVPCVSVCAPLGVQVFVFGSYQLNISKRRKLTLSLFKP